ncbi:MAG: hypothetical protein QNJ29_08140 [Rhizobiaceae bacterium]|nr:hypothetical protein [Rhizobiaceae bacterium]
MASMLLAACQSQEIAGPPVLNGDWASTDGVYVATLLNGSFQATANDTGQVISRGEYTAISSEQVQINWTGLVSGTTNQANCTKPDPNRLDCVDANGNRFSLVRSTTTG